MQFIVPVMSRPVTNLIRSLSHILAAVFNDRSQFEKLWQEQPVTRADWVPIRWKGEWLSQVNAHHGELRCLLRREGSTRLEARFHATYARWLRVAYGVALVAEESSQHLRLKGQADLGMFAGGVYEYDGELNKDRFECAYRCKYDHGTFHLTPWTCA